MKPSPKFNHRPKFEGKTKAPASDLKPSAVFYAQGTVDSDFEDMGERLDYALVPDVTIHFGAASEGCAPSIEHASARLAD